MEALLVPAALIVVGLALLYDPYSRTGDRSPFMIDVWDIARLLGGKHRPLYCRIAGLLLVVAGLILGGVMAWAELASR